MVEFYDSAIYNLEKGKECNRTDLIAYANYECSRLCFILVPLRGEISLGPCPQNKILVPSRGRLQKNSDEHPRYFYMRVSPGGAMGNRRIGLRFLGFSPVIT